MYILLCVYHIYIQPIYKREFLFRTSCRCFYLDSFKKQTTNLYFFAACVCVCKRHCTRRYKSEELYSLYLFWIKCNINLDIFYILRQFLTCLVIFHWNFVLYESKRKQMFKYSKKKLSQSAHITYELWNVWRFWL